MLRHNNPDNEPIVTQIEITPAFKEMVKRLTEEEERDAGLARKVRG